MKKTLSAILAGVFAFSTLSALAAELPGKYPEHNALTARQHRTGTAVPGASPEENVFYVEDDYGKLSSFVLLDKDADGNYFVITKNKYGTHPYTTMTRDAINKPDVNDSDWYFDPGNENRVAYWLNDTENGFLKNGNGSRKQPSAIVDNIFESDRQIENNYTERSGLKKEQLSDEKYKEALDWIDAKSGLRTVRSKLSFLSYTEYLTYNDKIGATKTRGVDGWAGFMTRSTRAAVSVSDGAATVSNKFYHVCGSNGTQKFVQICSDGNMISGYARNAYSVRPIMWLDKDFFKTVKLETEDTSPVGTNVLKQLTKYSRDELSAIYSAEELDKLGIVDGFTVSGILFKDAAGEEITSINGATAITAEAAVISKEAKDVDFIIAVYDGDNNLVKAEKQAISIAAGSNTYSVSISGINCGTNYKCKAFLWTDIMTPAAQNSIYQNVKK